MSRTEDRLAEREARRRAAAAEVDDRVLHAVESAPPLPKDFARRIGRLILLRGATIDVSTPRAMVDPSRHPEFNRIVAEAAGGVGDA